MDLDEAEVARLRQEILTFLIHEMKAASANGELRGAAAELAAPIAAQVEGAVLRAIDRRPATRDGVLTELDLQAVARMVGSLPSPTTPRAADPARVAAQDGGHAMRDLGQDLERSRQREAPDGGGDSRKALAYVAIGLALGLVLGVTIAMFMGGDGCGSSAGEPVERVAPTSAPVPTGVAPAPPAPAKGQ